MWNDVYNKMKNIAKNQRVNNRYFGVYRTKKNLKNVVFL